MSDCLNEPRRNVIAWNRHLTLVKQIYHIVILVGKLFGINIFIIYYTLGFNFNKDNWSEYDVLYFYSFSACISRDKNDWRNALILKTNKRISKKYPNYFNVWYSDNSETGSVGLNSDSLWRFLDPDRQQFFWWRWGHLYEQDQQDLGGNEGDQERVIDKDAA